VTAVTNSKPYDGTTSAAATPTISSGSLVGGDTATWTEAYQTAVVGTGKTLVPAGSVNDGNSGNNYAVTFANNLTGTITPATLYVNAEAKTKVYGAGDPLFTYNLTGFQFSEDATSAGVTGSASCTRLPGENIGDYAITCAQGTLAAANYLFATGPTANLAITPKLASVTPDAKTKVYGDADPTLTGTLTGFLVADGVTAAYSRTAGETVAGSPYTISAVLSPAGVLGNYTITYNTANFRVNPAHLTVRADNQARLYGVANPALTYVISGFKNSETVAVVSGAASCSTTATLTSTVSGSPYPVTCTVGSLSAANYDFPAGNFVAGALTVNSRPLTITANDRTKTYGAVVTFLGTEFTAGTSQLVNGDTVTSVTLTSAGAAASATVAGSPYPIVPSAAVGTGLANYAITYVNGHLTLASTLQFSVQPSSTPANAAIAPAIVVQVVDAGGTVVTSDNATKVTLAIGNNPGGGVLSCAPMTLTVSAGAASFPSCWIDEVAAGYTLTATDTTAGRTTSTGLLAAATSKAFDITPSALLTDIVSTDPDLNALDGFDVLFGKSSSANAQKLLNTNPGTFHYRLTLSNETGLYLHSRQNTALNGRNGASATTILTVPGLPAYLGSGILAPSGVLGDPDPAFTMSGSHAIHVHPYEAESVELDATISWAALSDTPGSSGYCSAVDSLGNSTVSWHAGQPADNAVVRCIKVENYAIPKHGKARIDVSYEFRWKGTDGWASTASSSFRAGFSFRDSTAITFDPPTVFAFASLAGTTVTGFDVVGLVGAGEKVTAIGGFLYDRNGVGIGPGAVVKLFSSSSGASCGAAPVAQDITTGDGFYFIWDAGTDQTISTNTLSSGVQYFVMVCPGTVGLPYHAWSGNIWPARSMDHKLGNKEFDEEDFYISPSTQLQFTQQPTNSRVSTSIPTIKVSVLDAFGRVVTGDQTTTITLMIGHNPGGGTLTGTFVNVPVVNGVATFTGLKISKAGVGYTLTATSAPFLTGAETVLFNINP
jgi:hypothetical protein